MRGDIETLTPEQEPELSREVVGFISGYVATFDVDKQFDQFHHGAFTKSLHRLASPRAAKEGGS